MAGWPGGWVAGLIGNIAISAQLELELGLSLAIAFAYIEFQYVPEVQNFTFNC